VSHPARFVLLLLTLLVFATALRADPSLDQVRRAQSLLGPDIWSQVIRVENHARASRYPRILHALVFELAGILWFYTATDGTQSFSLHAGRLAEEKANFSPLLRDIEPGFTRWSVVPADRLPRVIPGLALRNGCFIESVAGLRERLARGEPMERPRLLSFYANTSSGVHGHTVLAYGHGEHVEVFDPGQPDKRFTFAKAFGPDALALARALEGPEVVKARYVSIEMNATALVDLISNVERRSGGNNPVPDRS
jgi:hypothetical protein